MGVAVSGASVGVAAELAVVREPRVGAFDDPAQAEGHGPRRGVGAAFVAFLDGQVVESEGGQSVPDDGVVVAAIEVQRVDVGEQPVGCDVVEGGLEESDVVAVGAVDGPADRRAVTL